MLHRRQIPLHPATLGVLIIVSTGTREPTEFDRVALSRSRQLKTGRADMRLSMASTVGWLRDYLPPKRAGAIPVDTFLRPGSCHRAAVLDVATRFKSDAAATWLRCAR